MVYGMDISVDGDIGSEVDSTESLWYTCLALPCPALPVLKLTPPSHYGISLENIMETITLF